MNGNDNNCKQHTRGKDLRDKACPGIWGTRKEEVKMRRTKLFQLIWILLGTALVSWQTCIPSAFPASVPGVTDDTITIGVTTPMTGPASLYAKVGEMSECMFWEWGKNINGRNIKTIKLDDGCDPVKGIAAVKKLIFDEKVFLLFSGQCSNM